MSAPAAIDAALILIADDVPANVELLFDQLRTLGYNTVAAHDGPSALAAAFAHLPDLCILDVAMPAGDLGVEDRSAGFEVCRRIKRDARTARIPVVFVTALNDSTDRVKAIEAGGDDFLTKPHNRMVLGARVRSLLKLKAATDELEGSYRKLRELEKVRDDLMKMIVHDLKTPLTLVVANLEMLRDGDFGAVSAEQDGALLDAQGKSADLLGLIDDLLEVARIEDASLVLQRSSLEPKPFLDTLAAEWALRARQDGATVVVSVPEPVPTLSVDVALVRRLFTNLMQNAIVHSPPGVRVTLSAHRDGNGVRFAVTDTGVGIPEAYHDLIFRKFERVKLPSSPRVRGSGLGLSFCRLVAEAHGGRIWVQSTEGEGSSFHVVLPAVLPPAR